MAKNKNRPQAVEVVEEQPIDLLAAGSGEQGADEARYTVEAAGKTLALTLDELLELAARCIEAEQSPEGGVGVLQDVPELMEFVQQYPDVRAFPEEVAELIRQGKSPLDAYRRYENDDLRNKLRAFEQNEANQKTSLGSARGQADADDELQELMAIYNSVFR